MTIDDTVSVLPAALWPQGDIRDPLGIWGFRHGVTGDATGGSVKVIAQAPAGLGAAYVYTCYAAIIAQLSGVDAGGSILKIRLLTGWPNIDELAGVQAYGHIRLTTLGSDDNMTAPIGGPTQELVGPNHRFLLLFDPRPSAGALQIVELELDRNVLGETYSFEGYGYFWDRSVLQAPGGPRHPGAS